MSSKAAATHRTRSRICSAVSAATPRSCSTAEARLRSCCGATPAACGRAPAYRAGHAIPVRCCATRTSARCPAGWRSIDGSALQMTLRSRREALRYVGAALAGVGAAALGTRIAAAEPIPSAAAASTYLTGSFSSPARRGAQTNWAIARPPGAAQPLRPVIALHGRNGNATGVMDPGVQEGLALAIKIGWPLFAVVSVDGGANDYWHPRASGSDAGAMVINELLPMLAGHGIDTSRVALLGWSMGGYGALRLGAILGPARTAAICAVSPALWTSYSAVEPGAFDSADDWARNNVYGLPVFSQIPVRVDCGNSDRFCTATRQFVASLGRRPAGGFWQGGHDVRFWKSLMAADLTWLASLLTV